MNLAPWIGLTVGSLIFIVGCFVPKRSGGTSMMLMGTINAVVASTILLVESGSRFSTGALTACAIFLIAVVGMRWRENWRVARTEFVLAGGTILGIWVVYLLPADSSSSVRHALLVVVVLLAAAFLMVSAIRAVALVRDLQSAAK